MKTSRKCFTVVPTVAVIVLSCGLIYPPAVHADLADCFELDGSMLAPGKTHSTTSSGGESKYECTDQDRAFFEGLKKAKQQQEESARLVARAKAQAQASHDANLAYQAAQAREAESMRNALSSLSDSLNSIAAAKQQQAKSLERSADEIGLKASQYEAERAAQRGQEQIADQQARRISGQQPRAAPNAPARVDPLAKAPTPAQTAESRRAAGLPDDPNAAACIQDDDCARALLHGGNAAPTH
jgi:hypothetical protein